MNPSAGRRRVYLGGDHAAFDLKAALVEVVREQGREPVDVGPLEEEAGDDYPVYVLRAALAVAGDPGSLGVVLGGSGNGECIAANKVPGVRAALVHSVETAQLCREHNDAQVMAVGSRTTSPDVAREALRTFLSTPFGDEERHARRLDQLEAWERGRHLPPLPPGAPDVAGASPEG